MNRKILLLVAVMFLLTFSSKAQLGIRVGVNMANEITSLSEGAISESFKSSNLTGYQIGLIYQTNSKGLGLELGALLSQKGSVYQYDSDSTAVTNLSEAYKEINCITIPLNLKYKINLGPVGVYGVAGIYGDYALSGKTVNEALQKEKEESFNGIMDRLDYGYTLGFGVEALRKLQLGANWSTALQKKEASEAFYNVTNYKPTSTAKQFSVTLTYLF